MKPSFLAFYILSVLFCPVGANSQKLWQVKFDRLTTDDGLSQGMVNSIIQDKYGFMWFASNDGLNRYDGHHFTVFKNDPNDNNSIADNFIRFIFEDSEGRIWIATAGNGLDLFDRETENFIHFKYSANNRNGLSDNSITSIDEDKMKGIWIGTLHGLNRLQLKIKTAVKNVGPPPTDATKRFYRGNTATFTRISFDPANPDRELYTKEPGFLLADWRASNFHVDNQGLIWVSTQEKLFRIKPLTGSGYQVKELPIEPYMPIQQKGTGYEKYVQDFIPGPTPDIFYILFKDGITQVNSFTGQVQVLSKTALSLGAFSFPNVLDNTGHIWVCDENVTGIFNSLDNSWSIISTADKNTEPILKYMSCSYKDKAGNVWLGTKGYGLLKYDPAKNNFNRTETRYIRFMSAGKDENILFVKDPYDELFWEFNRETNSTKAPVPLSVFSNSSFPHFGNYTSAVLQDKDGSYWIGRLGLYHYDPVTKKAEEYWHGYENVFPLYDDGRDNLWFGNTTGIVQFNKTTKASTEYTFPAKTTMGPYDYLQAIHRDEKGMLWLGTLGGLYRFDPENKSWKKYQNIAGDRSSLNNNLIFSICPDSRQPDKYLWIGTKGGGLNLFNQAEETFTHFTEKHGLSNDVVYGILQDAAGNLWLSTNKGISRFDTKESFKNYNVNDGLQGSEYNRNAFCKSPNGYLYFGGITGFNYFDPTRLNPSNYIPSVWITAINVLNKPLQFGGQDDVLAKPAYLTNNIELKYEQNMISFEFASTDFSAVHNNRYQYQLEGFDNHWIEAGINNTATFTNLDPGSYTLRVKGSNSNGIWNETPTTLSITILPPWYLTWWFRTSVLIVLGSIVYAIHRYRMRKIIQMQKVRNDIAGDLHDEIGSNLSAIAVFSELAINPKKTKPEVDGLLKKISGYTQTSQDSMSDIVWMIDTKNDRLIALKLRMQLFANELLEARDISVRFFSDPLLDDLKLNMLQRKAVYLIFKEAIHNIIKYADATAVAIEINRKNNFIVLTISDNGKGFSLSEQENKNVKGGNGLKNMKLRAGLINAQLLIEPTINVGTTISLQFSA
ncbi:MAG: two-component regulator propeller domain-containing protein [Ferruginibacter sp.]